MTKRLKQRAMGVQSGPEGGYTQKPAGIKATGKSKPKGGKNKGGKS